MRDGIVEQLPANLENGKLVFIMGHENETGFNHMKGLVNQLNRSDEWIRMELKSNVKEIPQNSAIALTMVGITSGTLANIRRSAEQRGVPCIRAALTVGEVKEVLNILKERRVKPVPQNTNGSGTNGHEVAPSAVQAPIPLIQEVEVLKVTEVAKHHHVSTLTEIDLALKALHSFGDRVEETQLAVLVIADQLKTVTLERDGLLERLTTLKQEKVEASSLLAKSERENEVLRADRDRLQEALNGLDALIKGVRSR